MASPDSAGGSDVAGASDGWLEVAVSAVGAAAGATGSGALEHPANVSKTAQWESNIPRQTRMHASRQPALAAQHIETAGLLECAASVHAPAPLSGGGQS
ncbi:hypothetical protein GCM10011488_46520 [Steroidobacter agaridevorans]|nr:hypothetical protein GCM10011488_46520 [Steroidobacter agaridevorans]